MRIWCAIGWLVATSGAVSLTGAALALPAVPAAPFPSPSEDPPLLSPTPRPTPEPLPPLNCETAAPEAACQAAQDACRKAASEATCEQIESDCSILNDTACEASRSGRVPECPDLLSGLADPNICHTAVPACAEAASFEGAKEPYPFVSTACQKLEDAICGFHFDSPNMPQWIFFAACEAVQEGHVTFCMAFPDAYCELFGEGVPSIQKAMDTAFDSADVLAAIVASAVIDQVDQVLALSLSQVF